MLINKKVSSFGFQVFNNQKPQTKNHKPIKKIIINQCKSASNKNINMIAISLEDLGLAHTF